MHILLIEDDEMYAGLVEMALTRENIKVTVASNPTLGLELIESEQPHAIVLDVSLPQMSGLAVLDIARNDHGSSIPIIIATASGTLQTRHDAESLGADAFLEKPFSMKELARLIYDLVGA